MDDGQKLRGAAFTSARTSRGTCSPSSRHHSHSSNLLWEIGRVSDDEGHMGGEPVEGRVYV